MSPEQTHQGRPAQCVVCEASASVAESLKEPTEHGDSWGRGGVLCETALLTRTPTLENHKFRKEKTKTKTLKKYVSPSFPAFFPSPPGMEDMVPGVLRKWVGRVRGSQRPGRKAGKLSKCTE